MLALFDEEDQFHRRYDGLLVRERDHCIFFVSDIVLGETVHKLIDKQRECMRAQGSMLDLTSISRKLQYYNIELRGAPAREVMQRVIDIILEKDNRLSHNDLLIAAIAVADSQSIGLITTDGEKIGNKAIMEAAEDVGKSDFIISDNPFKRR